MANYIAWYGKKREHLVAHEREFATLLESGAEVSKLREAAEEVRAARVRMLKSRRAELSPCEKNATAVSNLDLEIETWLGLSVDEVIEGYRTGRFKARVRRAIRRGRK